MYGTAQQYPGHVLATKEVVVVTFNYRLGALGKLQYTVLKNFYDMKMLAYAGCYSIQHV